MSKPYNVRHSWDYVVTHSLPCSACNVLKPEKEVVDRSSYIYGEGWLKAPSCCISCFDSRKKEMESHVKPMGWDSV